MSQSDAPDIRRKNLRIDQRKIDRAMRILGTRTETETIERALDLVGLREGVLAALDSLEGPRTLDDPFSDDVEP
jgi:Arc/MetJ family transcription regulator